ncbi:hypothetical protein GOBAR_DD23623 [Gossypium barbadense]|nr:hypothetical protein GOBAR_DD23623 [Gossypium barbadense]
MELEDDEDMETMVALYCPTRSVDTEPIQLFVELVDMELVEDFTPLNGYDNNGCSGREVEDYSDPDLDEVPDDINNKDANGDGNVYASSVGNPSRSIIIRNDPGSYMSIVDPDAAYASEFPKCFGVPWRSIYCSHHISTNFHRDYKNAEWRKQVVTMAYELEQYRFKQRLASLEADMHGEMNSPFREWLGTMNYVLQAGHVFVKEVNMAMDANAQKVRRYYCGKFQTLWYPCLHVVAAFTHVLINIEKYIDKMYTLEHILHIWGNEFPTLHDMSTWEVPPLTFELVSDMGLRRKPKCRPRVTKIHGEIDLREKTDPKRYSLCRIVGHNQGKCPHRTYHPRQS